MLVFGPIFLMRARIGLSGAGLALIVSEFIPMSMLSFLLSGRMKTKFQWESLFAKFDIETWKAVKIGGTQFFFRKFLTFQVSFQGSTPALLLNLIMNMMLHLLREIFFSDCDIFLLLMQVQFQPTIFHLLHFHLELVI
jgi:Na+-driven multidrug efflux pump